MSQKYIVMMLDDKEVMFTFPESVVHSRMFEALGGIRFGDNNWERKLHDGKAVSAGFIANGVCHGRSETMDLGSRPELDTALLAQTLGQGASESAQAPRPAAQSVLPRFPAMLRKMWSGSEVQAWIDEHLHQPAQSVAMYEVDWDFEPKDPIEEMDAILREYEKSQGLLPGPGMSAIVSKTKERLLTWWCHFRADVRAALVAAELDQHRKLAAPCVEAAEPVKTSSGATA